MGDRFFVFGIWEKPRLDTLAVRLNQCGFKYDPESTFLASYGVWFDWCVDTWKDYSKSALGLSPGNCRKIPELSVSLAKPIDLEDIPVKIKEPLGISL